MSLPPYTLNDQTWDDLMAVTHGAIAVCYQCGVCTASCPWNDVKDHPYAVRSILRQAQLGLPGKDHDLWLCTTCGQCEVNCPRGVKITDVVRGLRYLAWQTNCPHPGLNTLLWSVYWNNNPWEQPPSHRVNWSKSLKVPIFNPAEHEVLIYVGCTPSYDHRAQKITLSLLKVLQAAGISFGILGEEEPCSGEEVHSVGHLPYFLEISSNVAKVLVKRGVTHLVTIDPHSYDTFKNHYKFSQPIKIQHYSQYLAELIQSTRLKNLQQLGNESRTITYHDPCYLSRHNQELDKPRLVLAEIPGTHLVEMENYGLDTLCCGGGGGRMWIDTDPAERFSNLRVAQAIKSEANILATACPYCISCLEDSIKDRGFNNIQVLDIAEIVAMSLD